MKGTVINIHFHGALVRLEDGSLASVAVGELEANRAAYAGSLGGRTALDLTVDVRGRHPVVTLGPASTSAVASGTAASAERVPAPRLIDPIFEERIGAYLKETEVWAPPDRPEPAERHFIRKKRRAAVFEARNKAT